MAKECRTAREFGDRFRAEVWGRAPGWEWRRDMRPWLADMFGGAKFGDPDYDWSPEAARALAREFLSEAESWC